jgi:hypothetical protein
MPDGRDVYRPEATSDGRGEDPAGERSRDEREWDRRARYLAKAASLGQVVREDEPFDGRY